MPRVILLNYDKNSILQLVYLANIVLELSRGEFHQILHHYPSLRLELSQSESEVHDQEGAKLGESCPGDIDVQRVVHHFCNESILFGKPEIIKRKDAEYAHRQEKEHC